MDWTRTLSACALFLAVGHTHPYAQLCTGRPALRNVTIANMSAAASFAKGRRLLAGQVTAGRALFGSASLGVIDYDAGASEKTVTGTLGYTAHRDGSSTSYCGTIETSYRFGIQNLLGEDLTTLAFAPGLAIGIEKELHPAATIVPFGALQLIHSRLSADNSGSGVSTDNSGLVTLGAGLIFNARLGFRSFVSFPVATSGIRSSFSLEASIAFGRSR